MLFGYFCMLNKFLLNKVSNPRKHHLKNTPLIFYENLTPDATKLWQNVTKKYSKSVSS